MPADTKPIDLAGLRVLLDGLNFVPTHIDHPIMVEVNGRLVPWYYVTEPGHRTHAAQFAAFVCEEDAEAFRALVLATPALLDRIEALQVALSEAMEIVEHYRTEAGPIDPYEAETDADVARWQALLPPEAPRAGEAE